MHEDVAGSLRVFLAGGFRVYVGDREVPPGAWRLRKASAAVKLLALAPGFALHRDQLLEALWPDLDPQAATNNLHQALYFARNALEPARGRRARSHFLRWAGDTLRLEAPGGVWVDVAEFEAQAARAPDFEALSRAFELYRGELLPEDQYEDWAAAPREALRLRFQSVALALARAAADSGDTSLAERALYRLLETDRALEPAHVELIRLSLKAGDRARAARQYAEMVAALQGELGTEPGPEARRLLEQIGFEVPLVSARERREPRRPPRLPLALTSFVGRERELRAVAGALDRHRLVTLVGPPGVGKTRLALEAVRRTPPAGLVHFVDLSSATPERVGSTVRSALLLPDDQRRTDLEAVTEYLLDRSLLLILDNCEHVLDSCAAVVSTLLDACAGLRVLATSRQPLGLPGEAVLRVPPLDVPPAPSEGSPPLQPDALVRFEAVALFVERARLADPTFRLTEDNAAAVAELCRRLDGLSLAIELAAARVACLPPGALLERLSDRFRLLVSHGQTRSARHRTLRAALDWSYDLLSQAEAQVFLGLSVFAGGCTPEAAEAVVRDVVPPDTVLDVLGRLVDKCLVAVTDGPRGTIRYGLLDTLRAYGEEHLGVPALGEARRRHARFFLALAEQAAPALAGPDVGAWPERLEVEHENLRAAVRWAVANEPETALRMVVALGPYAETRGRLAEVRSWGRTALEASAGAPSALRARACLTNGRLSRLLGDLRDAEVVLQEALSLSEAETDPVLTAHVLNELGVVAHIKGDYEGAAARAHRALNLLRPSGDHRGLATALNLLGLVAHHRGEFDTAQEYFTETLELARAVGDRRTVAVALNNLGSVALYREDYERAWVLFHEALAIQRKLENRRSVANLLSNPGDTARGLRQQALAKEMHRQALTERAAMKDRPGVATSLLNLAYVAVATGDLERAAVLLAAGDRVRSDAGIALPATGHEEFDRHLSAVRAGLGQRFAEAWARGSAMTPEEAVAYALEDAGGRCPHLSDHTV